MSSWPFKTLCFLVFLVTASLIPGACQGGTESPAKAQEVRPPAVAGAFYPADASELSPLVQGYLDRVPRGATPGKIVGIVAPHAGLIYSGPVAAYAYKQLPGADFKTVVLVGPSHYVDFKGVSVYDRGAWKTPLGEVKIDTALAKEILAQNSAFTFYPEAHRQEHSLEVQLPFLQKVLPAASIVPLVMGRQDQATVEALAQALSKVLKDKPVLLVASSDWSHYHPAAKASALDQKGLECVEKLDGSLLMTRLHNGYTQACGGGPVAAVLMAAKALGADHSTLLKYGDSGDITGDKQSVVGYAAVILTRGTFKPGADAGLKPAAASVVLRENYISSSGQKKLLEIARRTIEAYVTRGEIPAYENLEAELLRPGAAFVTINKNGRLRGCIGYTEPYYALAQTVTMAAAAAATRDSRFPPVDAEELKELHVEISVLTPRREVQKIEDIQVGIHGLIITQGRNSGLLLPQVATQYGWDRQTFLEQCCLKAGLPKDAWKSGAKIYSFTAQVFGE